MFTKDFQSEKEMVYSQTIEQLVDRLHELTSEGRYADAKVVAQKIKDIEYMFKKSM